MNTHKPAHRLTALALSMLMVFGMTPITVSAQAMEGNSAKNEIIAFEALEEDVATQQLAIGTSLEELHLPQSLNATVRVATATDAQEPDEPVLDSGDLAPGDDAVTPGDDAVTWEDDAVTQEGDKTPAEANSGDSTDGEPQVGTPSEKHEDEQAKPEVSETSQAITLKNVEWMIDAETSSSDTFDSSENGDYYTFVPIIPEGYTVADSIDLPEIGVQVGSAMMLMTAVAETITISENIVCANGVPIVIKENGGITGVYDQNGTLLSGTTDVKDKWIAGGWQSDDHEGDTSVTVESGTLTKKIYGGNFKGTLTGNTSITINGGSVGSIYGANEQSGAVTGNTNIEVNAGTVTGWIYGGGAGVSENTNIGGDTRIAINGGKVNGEIYGGGRKAGTTAGTVTIIAASPNQINSIYAGGEGVGNTNYTVGGDVSIEVKSGTVESIYGSGGGYVETGNVNNSSTSTVGGKVKVILSGGTVKDVYAAFFMNNVSGAQVSGDFSVIARGGQIQRNCYLGAAISSPQNMKNISLILSGQTEACSVQIPALIADSLDITIENCFQELTMAAGVLSEAKNATLLYENCGTKSGTWAAYSGNSHTVGTNPYTAFAYINDNQFDSLTLKNCYLDYDNYVISSGSLKTIAKSLALDGGALRTYLAEDALFPATDFLNNPLLLYGYKFQSGYGNPSIIFDAVTGNAELATIAVDGKPNTAAFSALPTFGLVVAPNTTPKDTFSYINLRSSEAYLLGTDTFGSPTTQTTWKLLSEDACRCEVFDVYHEERYFHMDSGTASKTVTLKERQDGNTEYSANCPIPGHTRKPVTVDYAVENSSDSQGAAITNGNELTVTSPGTVDVKMIARLNNKEKVGVVRTAFIGLPEQLSFTDKTGGNGTISLALKGSGLSAVGMRNNTTTYSAPYISNFSNGTLTVTLGSEYLNSLALGSYQMQLTYNCNGIETNDTILFNVTITDKDTPVITANDITVTYTGAALDASSINGTATHNGQPVAGTWIWKNSAPSNVHDSGKHTLVFTPSDESTYEVSEADVNVTIQKATPTGAPKYATILKSGRTLADASLAVEGGTFSTMGSVKWVDPSGSNLVDTTTVTANTSYRWLFTPADTANYNTLSGAVVLYTVSNGGDSDDSSGSGGGSSSGSSTTITTPGKTPNQPVTAAAPVTATAGVNGAASASIPEKSVTDAIAKAQADAKAQGKAANGTIVALNVTMPRGATALTTTLTRQSLDSLISAGVSSLEINGSLVSVSFDKKALAEIQKQSTGNISIAIAPKTNLSDTAKKMIGTRPVYDITVGYGSGKSISSFNGGIATVAIPYTLGKNEAVGGLYAVYVDAKGNATRIAGSAYDANSGCVIFTTTHFSQYGIGYTAPTAKFTDISSHWAKESIDYVVGRGLLSGTTETTFAPDTAMTRGMLVTALGRLANVDTKAYTTSSFMDVTLGSAFQPYIEWAYKKGIVQGTGNGKFEPDRAVTREEIAVIFANFAKATGYTLPVTRTATTYADASSIGSTYKTAVTAMQQAGIMMGGTSNKFNPKSSATRAEVSSMLHRYIKVTIEPDTAQGWAKNDAGQCLYYKDGKALTGTQTIGGTKYFFNTNGTLKTGWVKDDTGNWRFYSGNTLLVGFWDLGAGGNNKTYYFNKDGIMVAGKWLEIDSKWYYLNADGSLAKSTKIDGYEVDEKGVRKSK